MKILLGILLLFLCPLSVALQAQTDTSATDTILQKYELEGVVVKAAGSNKSRHRVSNTEIIGIQQLSRAACCNLGESFTTNPSVDVSYSDAATGARQIKLLGLSGTYVQMLTENIPNLRGAGIPYALGYVPGPWMQAIQVSKGAASVKNGYESITGQIDIEYLKPQGTDGVRGNLYPAYGQLQAQLTREFRRFSLYAGGENLTGYRIPTPILHADNPWSPGFDATQVWGPTEGAMAYIGIRFKFEKL